jgi:hypothetical protein
VPGALATGCASILRQKHRALISWNLFSAHPYLCVGNAGSRDRGITSLTDRSASVEPSFLFCRVDAGT